MSLYRVYFNRCEDWPQIWSIDEGAGTLETNVCDWRTEGAVTMRGGRVLAQDTQIDRTREPFAWCEVDAASVRLESGVAVFRDALADA